MSTWQNNIAPDGYADIYQLLKEIMREKSLEEISQYFEIKEGRIVVKNQRKISSLLMLELLRTLTQGGITK